MGGKENVCMGRLVAVATCNIIVSAPIPPSHTHAHTHNHAYWTWHAYTVTLPLESSKSNALVYVQVSVFSIQLPEYMCVCVSVCVDQKEDLYCSASTGWLSIIQPPREHCLPVSAQLIRRLLEPMHHHPTWALQKEEGERKEQGGGKGRNADVDIRRRGKCLEDECTCLQAQASAHTHCLTSECVCAKKTEIFSLRILYKCCYIML